MIVREIDRYVDIAGNFWREIFLKICHFGNKILLLATMLLLNYYSRSLPTETQKFSEINFWKVYNISEISKNTLYGRYILRVM